jgi:hypothetical protein
MKKVQKTDNAPLEVFTTINIPNLPVMQGDFLTTIDTDNTNLKVDIKGGVRALEVYKTNPYIVEAKVKQVIKSRPRVAFRDKGEEVVNTKTGEIFGNEHKNVVVQHERVDRAKFVRIYVEEISRMANLPQYAWKLFHYILANLGVKKDEVYIHSEVVLEWCGWTRPNQLQKALICLAKKGFIAKSNKPYWWYINPSIFFNGDRAAFIRLYEVDNQKQIDFGNG